MSKVTMADALAAGDGVLRNEQLQECIKALEWYEKQALEMYYSGGSSGVWELCEDRGRRAKEAIAKAKGVLAKGDSEAS
jgi:hypothetical protein